MDERLDSDTGARCRQWHSGRQLKKIFEKYLRGGENKHIQGTGLGLHVSKKIAESHNGSLTVSSEVGIGSTFVFRLPISDLG